MNAKAQGRLLLQLKSFKFSEKVFALLPLGWHFTGG